jgi:predicted HicB family RNase H-like nuclease
MSGPPMVYSERLQLRITPNVMKALKKRAKEDELELSEIIRTLLIGYIKGKIPLSKKKIYNII